MMQFKNIVLTFLFATLAISGVQAQLRMGFKTGLNFSHMTGPSETDASGNSLESSSNVTGFHIGATAAYHFSNSFGIRAEAMYSKRGGKYNYNGQAYRFFKVDNSTRLTNGNATYIINVNNSYIDIPLMAFVRWRDFEFSGGAYAGFLVGSLGTGSLRYTGYTANGNSTGELVFNLNHNYRRDDPGGSETTGGTITATVDGREVTLPKTLGAYYDYADDKGALYNSVDYGVVAGVSYYLSRSLYAGVRLQYGLSDATNNNADIAKARLGENMETLLRDDKDQLINIQVSVGFSF